MPATISVLHRMTSLESDLNEFMTQARQIERIKRLGSWSIDLETGHLKWSEGTYRIFGLEPSEPMTVEKALTFYAADTRAALVGAIEAATSSGESYDLVVAFRTASGRPGWIRTIGEIDAGGGTRRLVGVVEDVTEDKADQDRLRDLAFCDALTGLPNRRAFETRLSEIERRRLDGVSQAALLLVDIDHFKTINDTLGHPAGDRLLVEVAGKLQRNARSSDLVARIGGDEFAVILVATEGRAALDRKVATLVEAIREPACPADGTMVPTLSIGVAHSDTAIEDGLFKAADLALYGAKQRGRNRVHVFEPSLRARADRNAEMLECVRRALGDDELAVFYQPIVDLRTGVVRGLEALVRWDHPQHGILGPAAFEAAFLDPVLSVAIDDLVLDRSLRQMRAWLDQGVPVAAVNVNASETQLRRPDLVERVLALLERYGLGPERLKIEVVETVFLGRDPKQVAATIARLAELGVVCALDDFGTGYASLVHLKQFRVERIKIDRSFVANIGTNDFDRGLVRSLIDLGHNLGIRVTAEGVETDEQLALLREFGCDCAQGYLIGRPTAAEGIPETITRWYARQAAHLAAVDADPHGARGSAVGRRRMRAAGMAAGSI